MMLFSVTVYNVSLLFSSTLPTATTATHFQYLSFFSAPFQLPPLPLISNISTSVQQHPSNCHHCHSFPISLLLFSTLPTATTATHFQYLSFCSAAPFQLPPLPLISNISPSFQQHPSNCHHCHSFPISLLLFSSTLPTATTATHFQYLSFFSAPFQLPPLPLISNTVDQEIFVLKIFRALKFHGAKFS